MDSTATSFIAKYKEQADMNQYWYSPNTIFFLARQVVATPKVCFMSTPSIYFSVPTTQVKQGWTVFDVGSPQYSSTLNLAKTTPTTSNMITNAPKRSRRNTAVSSRWWWLIPPSSPRRCGNFLKEGGKILVSSIDENDKMLQELIGVRKVKFRPSIPHLVYQYSFYSNFEDPELDQVNSEIGF